MDSNIYTFNLYNTRAICKAQVFFNEGKCENITLLRFRLFHGKRKQRVVLLVKQLHELENLFKTIQRSCPNLNTVVIDAMHTSMSFNWITDCLVTIISRGSDGRKLEMRLENFDPSVFRDLDLDRFNEQTEVFAIHVRLLWSQMLDAEVIAGTVALLKGLPTLRSLVLDVPHNESASTIDEIMDAVDTEELKTAVCGWRLQRRP